MQPTCVFIFTWHKSKKKIIKTNVRASGGEWQRGVERMHQINNICPTVRLLNSDGQLAYSWIEVENKYVYTHMHIIYVEKRERERELDRNPIKIKIEHIVAHISNQKCNKSHVLQHGILLPQLLCNHHSTLLSTLLFPSISTLFFPVSFRHV